jgi:hypothetical protein
MLIAALQIPEDRLDSDLNIFYDSTAEETMKHKCVCNHLPGCKNIKDLAVEGIVK